MKKTKMLVNFRNFHTNHHLPRDLENKIFGFLPSVLIFVAKKGSFKCWKTMTGALKKFILSRGAPLKSRTVAAAGEIDLLYFPF